MNDHVGSVRRLALLGALGVLAPFGEVTGGRAARAYDTGQKAAPPPTRPSRAPTAGRNEPCPCGSGAKYKRCCRLAHQGRG